MIFEVTILGCGAAAPTTKHNPSAQVVNVHDKLFLVDCGEGTQMQLRHNRIKFQRIHHIFISHLHGDHYLGLVGLISSFHLLGRKNELHIYGPADLKTLVEINLKLSDTFLNFPLIFHATLPKEVTLLYEDATLTVESIPLKHRIECTGFLFREKEHVPRIKKERVIEHRLQPTQILALKRGESVVLSSGEELTSAAACYATPEQRSYAYCSDTAYKEDLVEQLRGVDLLYHEATFIETEAERAKFTFHSTAKQAATLALKAEVKELLLGHFSSRYKTEQPFLDEAQPLFPATRLAAEGLTFSVGYLFEVQE